MRSQAVGMNVVGEHRHAEGVELSLFVEHTVNGELVCSIFLFFFFNDTATTEIYTLSLHDALPIWIRYFGAGTQRVEAELRGRWPGLRVARLDSDAIAARRGFETVYDDFREGRTDVLVGTQLAAKGLDLPAVTLAAVIAADVTLNLPDYRAAERTFQLVAQVAGRAGRGDRPGRVIVQTYAPSHYAIRAAAALDVDGFA